ncbi:MAG TPA: PQQ-dependent sugar dehydrogenase [Gammaproteobacteria bacterium]
MKAATPLLAFSLVTLAGCGGGAAENASPGDAGRGSAPADTGIELPPGFTATVFADGLDRPRHIAVRDNGDVYVTLRTGQAQLSPDDSPGGIAALRDTDGDGRADVVQRFGRADADTGLAISGDTLYFSSTTAIYAVPLAGDALVPAAEPEVVVAGLPASGGGHASKPITLDGAGHLYSQVGAPSNACEEQARQPLSPGLDPCPLLETYGGVFRYSANARNQNHAEDGIRYSTGHRNVVALEWNPLSNELFLVMHGRDQLDTLWPQHFTQEERVELPAEEFHVVAQGDDLGWPYTYYDHLKGQRMLAPEYGGDGETPAEPGKYKDPLIGFPGHWAPNDLLFYTGTQFPERYRGGAFIAFHGSWNRAPAEQGGYNVVFVPMRDGRPSGDWEIFADDFEGPVPITSPADAAHRPSGLAQGPDGSLYVSDDTGGRVWKITYRGT